MIYFYLLIDFILTAYLLISSMLSLDSTIILMNLFLVLAFQLKIWKKLNNY